jgi:cellulose 1,4-beta-cellobiosidase
VTEIWRKDVQCGKVIDNSFTKLNSLTKQYNSVSDHFCVVQKKAFGENDSFAKRGGFRQLVPDSTRATPWWFRSGTTTT